MPYRSFLPFATMAALLATPALARVDEDVQAWANFTVIGTVGPRLAYFAEVQPRTADGAGRIGQLLLRPALGWRFSNAVTGYLGYARVIGQPRTGPDTHENRTFAQLSWDLGAVAGGRLTSRTRLERREVSTGRDTGWRVREFLRYTHPLTTPDKPRALVYEEVFAVLDDTDWGARAGFDQARTFVGLEVPLAGSRTTIDIGYLNQTINDPGGRLRVNHVASLTVWIRP